jgi:hypothetical protein
VRIGIVKIVWKEKALLLVMGWKVTWRNIMESRLKCFEN